MLADTLPKSIWFFEEELIGEFVKYVDNEDFSEPRNPTTLHRALSTLVHFDFEKNDQNGMICDFQGVNGILTDPAVIDKR